MYKVGGYVRDKILGIKSKDIDYVVVGADIEYMLRLGLIPVGRHFPVFIDPKSGTQYALARTERKTGLGYHGFEFYAAPDVTLEQDLKRRDLTINAIAEDENGQLIDPFNGIGDLKNKIIRHTSAAFIEDPLRVLRVARFRAKLGFDIAPETIMLMRKISNSGELEHLSNERIWDEVRKSLDCNNPLEFFTVLNLIGALEHILCEFKIILEDRALFTKLHSDLITAIKLKYSPEEKFAIIISDAEIYQLNITKKIISDCKLGHNYTELASIISKTHTSLLKLDLNNPQEILQLVNQLSPLRRYERFQQITKTLTITATGNELLNLKFLEKIACNFEQIDYENIKKTEPNNYIYAINQKKLSIISETTQQFFGT